MAQSLFNNTDLPLGVRVEFNFQWSEWIKDVHKPTQAPENLNDKTQSKKANHPDQTMQSEQSIQQTIQSDQAIQSDQTNPSLAGTSSSNQYGEQPPLILNSILQSNQYGMSLLKAVAEKKPMNDNLRQILCDAILQYCIEKNRALSVKDCASLARQICNVFPDELMVFFYFSDHFHLATFIIIFIKYIC